MQQRGAHCRVAKAGQFSCLGCPPRNTIRLSHELLRAHRDHKLDAALRKTPRTSRRLLCAGCFGRRGRLWLGKSWAFSCGLLFDSSRYPGAPQQTSTMQATHFAAQVRVEHGMLHAVWLAGACVARWRSFSFVRNLELRCFTPQARPLTLAGAGGRALAAPARFARSAGQPASAGRRQAACASTNPKVSRRWQQRRSVGVPVCRAADRRGGASHAAVSHWEAGPC